MDEDIISGDCEALILSMESGLETLEYLHKRTMAIEALANRTGGNDPLPEDPQELPPLEEEA